MWEGLNPEFELPHFFFKLILSYPVTFGKWAVSNLSRNPPIVPVIVDSRHQKALELIVYNDYSVMNKNR